MTALRPQALLGGGDRVRMASRGTSLSSNAMAVSLRGKTACGRAPPRCLALPPLVSACPLNLNHERSQRRGCKLILRGFAGAEGKDDRAP